jgi:molybdopterin-synthase adenylyltransferase
MNDDQLLRYSRHILLDDIGIEGQQRLLDAHALVIGAGGLGSPVALYLGTAGVGRLTVVDHDTVDVTNLQRQIAHNLSHRPAQGRSRCGTRRGPSTPTCRCTRWCSAPTRRCSTGWCRADVVLDCSDNFATRHAVNAACVRHGKPLVSGAAIGFDGQMGGLRHARPEGAVLRLRVPGRGHLPGRGLRHHGRVRAAGGHRRQRAGRRGAEAAVGRRQPLAGQLLMLDARTMGWDRIAVPRDPRCRVCAEHRH